MAAGAGVVSGPQASAAELEALAARIERLGGPDREVDAEIAKFQGLRVVDEGHPLGRVCYNKARQAVALPRYTASLDAAMSLVPEGWYWMAGNRDRLSPRAYVENGAPAFDGLSSRRNPRRHWFEVTAATPALALTAAALRVRAHAAKEDRP